MIPSLYVRVSKLPLGPAGKLDRKRLRELAKFASPSQLDNFALAGKKQEDWRPATRAEQRMVDLWSRVLAIPSSDIAAESHFFRIGGDSVSAMRLVAQAERQDMKISVAQIFQNPTLGRMATAFTSGKLTTASEGRGLPPFSMVQDLYIESGGLDCMKEIVAQQCRIGERQIQDVLPCSAMQEGLVALSNKQSGAYVAKYWMPLSTEIDLLRFKQAWERVQAENEILRTRIVSYESQLLQVIVDETIEWHDVKPEVDVQALRHSRNPDEGVATCRIRN